MNGISVYELTIFASLLIILSYIFNIVSKKSRIPSVILLIFLGIFIREILISVGKYILLPDKFIEFVGVIGLIMIVLDAGLSLKYNSSKIRLIRNAFFSSFFALALSVIFIALTIHFKLGQSKLSSIVYAVPLSVLSSSIIMSSISTLNEKKREFLAYESSFSDILGILLFDLMIATTGITFWSVSIVGISIAFAFVASVFFSILLVWILMKSSSEIKFYLMFAILLMLYSLGKLFHLPSLIILLVFGLTLNNWSKINVPFVQSLITDNSLAKTKSVLKSITIETTFLVRTVFFVLFGYSINVFSIINKEVVLTGSLIVLTIYIVRFVYLKLFVTEHVLPEIFYAPRGLVTILLFYKIPDALKLEHFNEGIILYVILLTSIVMMIGSIIFKPEAGKAKTI